MTQERSNEDETLIILTIERVLKRPKQALRHPFPTGYGNFAIPDFAMFSSAF
jgi:hypothetical protein